MPSCLARVIESGVLVPGDLSSKLLLAVIALSGNRMTTMLRIRFVQVLFCRRSRPSSGGGGIVSGMTAKPQRSLS
jgi:hypothetical protein